MVGAAEIETKQPTKCSVVSHETTLNTLYNNTLWPIHINGFLLIHNDVFPLSDLRSPISVTYWNPC